MTASLRMLHGAFTDDLGQLHLMELPCGSEGGESTCSAGDLGSIPGLGRSPGGEHGKPLQYSCLVGYSPWGRKESDMTG